MRRSLIFIAPFIVALMLIACRRSNPEAAALLARADSLLNPAPSTAASQTPPAGGPQGALRLLDSVQHQARTAWPKADRMRYELLLAEAMNKSYRPFTTDSVLKQVVRYYDRHGSSNFWSSERLISWLRDGRVVTKVSAANQRLKAHYLLGCAYRDMGEAPAAINAWQEAVDCADTLSTDCDYTTLFSLYGQMAYIFQAQQLTTMELEAYQNYSKYAKLAGDIYEYIRGIEFMVIPFYQQQDTAKVFETTRKARDLYLQYGMTEAAARVYPTAISVAVQYGLYDRARAMMQIFESHSGLLDKSYNIEKGYELYYQSKGLYYLGVEQLDSAECFFRKLLSSGFQVEGYRGMLQVYQKRQIADSILRYTKLHEAAVFTMMSTLDAQATGQAASLYDYDRNEKLASLQTKEATQVRHVLTLVIIATCVIVMLSWLGLRQLKKKKEEESKKLLIQYQNSQEQASSLEKELVAAQEQFSKLKAPEREEQLKNTDIVKLFSSITKPQKERHEDRLIIRPARKATDNEWEELRIAIQEHLPTFYAFITTEKSLTKQQYRICMLFRIGFTGEEIATILGTPSSRISVVKRSLNEKLFKQQKNTNFIDNLKSL